MCEPKKYDNCQVGLPRGDLCESKHTGTHTAVTRYGCARIRRFAQKFTNKRNTKKYFFFTRINVHDRFGKEIPWEIQR
jgi:hypothetical protein